MWLVLDFFSKRCSQTQKRAALILIAAQFSADKEPSRPSMVPCSSAGNARVKDCLEEHREDPKFTQECRTEFEKMMGRRATDFRLDSSLREQCAEDIEVV